MDERYTVVEDDSDRARTKVQVPASGCRRAASRPVSFRYVASSKARQVRGDATAAADLNRARFFAFTVRGGASRREKRPR